VTAATGVTAAIVVTEAIVATGVTAAIVATEVIAAIGVTAAIVTGDATDRRSLPGGGRAHAGRWR
jgi:hypothetical protein